MRWHPVTRSPGIPTEPTRTVERAIASGIQSILIVTMWHANALCGYVGFDAVRRPLRWNGHDLIGLRLLSQVLAATLMAQPRAQASRGCGNPG